MLGGAEILVLIVVLLTALCLLNISAVGVRDGEALHDLIVETHTLRNRYLAELRGEPMPPSAGHPRLRLTEPETAGEF
jgi:hypothetical protein